MTHTTDVSDGQRAAPVPGWPLSGAAYERLRAEIVDGLAPPGTLLVEAVIAARLGISRTPVREALGRLEQDGLIERDCPMRRGAC